MSTPPFIPPRAPLALRVFGAAVFACVVARVLCYERGGFDIGPFVLFAVTAFLGAILWQYFFFGGMLTLLERGFRLLPYHTAIRYALMFLIFACVTIWAGPVISSWGYAAWLLLLVASVLVPAVVCPIAPRFPILFGIIAQGCILLSGLMDNSRLFSQDREIQWDHVFEHPLLSIFGWGIVSVISLVISVPVYLHRRRAQLVHATEPTKVQEV